MLHCLASDEDDPTVDPRWGKVGKQKITDEGPLPPNPMHGIKYNMETVDELTSARKIAAHFNIDGDSVNIAVRHSDTT